MRRKYCNHSQDFYLSDARWYNATLTGKRTKLLIVLRRKNLFLMCDIRLSPKATASVMFLTSVQNLSKRGSERASAIQISAP